MHFERHFDLLLSVSDMYFIQKFSGGAEGMMHSFEQLSNYKPLNGDFGFLPRIFFYNYKVLLVLYKIHIIA